MPVTDTQQGSLGQRMAMPERRPAPHPVTKSRPARRVAQTVVAVGVLVLGSAPASPALAAPTQEPEAAIAVTPSPVAAGSDIAVDGACPAGTAIAAITLYMSIGDHVMYYGEDLPAAADGSFATTVTIPTDAEAGTWTGEVDCDESGTASATTTFAVTGGAPPMSFLQEAPVDLTDGLTLSGAGCTAGDVPLATVSIDVFGYDNDGSTVALLGSAAATAAADGSWTATIMLPLSAATVDFSLATVECSSGDGTGWARYAEMPVSLGGFAQATTTTAPPTPTTAPRVALVRTGSSPAGGSIAAVGVALVACGALVRRAAARRRPALP